MAAKAELCVAKRAIAGYPLGMGRLPWRVWVDEISPQRVWLRGTGKIALQVRGFAVGWVRCNGQRRWTCGHFHEVFSVDPAQPARVVVRGLAGHVEQELAFHPVHRLSPPKTQFRVVQRVPRLPLPLCFPSPRVRMATLQLRVPRARLPLPGLAATPAFPAQQEHDVADSLRGDLP